MTSWKSLRRVHHRSPDGNSDIAQSVTPVLPIIVNGQESDFFERHPSHNFAIVDWGCDPGLETDGKDYYVTDSIRVNGRPFFEQIRNSLVAAQDDGMVAHEL